MKTRPEHDAIAAQLRTSAPLLPPDLRQKVLRKCQAEGQRTPVFARYGQWCLSGALAGLALFCWIASGRLDAQSQAMITGAYGQQPERLFASRAYLGKPVQTDSQAFGISLRWRLRQLASLLHDKHSG